MKNNKKFTMQINTGVKFSGAIFSRVYNLYILSETEDYSIINFDCYNLVPSGYIKGGSQKDLAMNIKVKFNDDNINKNIAKLALKLDKSLYEKTGFKELDISRSTILEKLKEKENTKDTIMEI